MRTEKHILVLVPATACTHEHPTMTATALQRITAIALHTDTQ